MSPTLALLGKRLRERGLGDKAFGMRSSMRPIYSALAEMDMAGVKVRTSAKERDVLAISNLAAVDKLVKTSILNLSLWNLEKERLEEIRLGEDDKHPGEYSGGLLTSRPVTEGGLMKRMYMETEMVESKHFQNAQEAVEWLVNKLAPCVVEANRLGLVDGDPGPLGR